MNTEHPKCLDLMDAIAEVRFWIGVNMARFDYDFDALKKLLLACLEFTKEASE